ncbi:hypothetical protein JM658_00285 [Joostella atrarenae]|uniref:DUF3857 domain-containing protein n=1 Tax=Joostella atrarenae TaxID=679257 RepID=A0ABS9IYI7_9FLAO|nr:hypothetical protein [Joostella atrarenae]MCF8713253.1 hypothetical protein [Joostella atrarenae]
MRFFILPLILLFAWKSSGQAADIDKQYFPVAYVKLPTNPILNENERTYNVSVVSDEDIDSFISEPAISNDIQISGFLRDEVAPQVFVKLNFKNFLIDAASFKVEDKLVEEKDDDGNVTRSYRIFRYVFRYAVTAMYTIENPLDLEMGNDITKAEVYASDYYNSKKEAFTHYEVNKEEIKENILYNFVDNVSYRLDDLINATFGYRPYKTNSYLWILDSKKNPLTVPQKAAFEKTIAAMESVTHDMPIEQTRNALKPIVEDFVQMAGQVEGDSRRERKVMYACYYNASVLSYYMDLPEEAIKYAEMIYPLEYGERDAENLREKALDLEEILSVNMVDSRRMEVQIDEKFSEFEVSDFDGFAYLVTAKNDTLIANMNYGDLENVGAEAKVYLPDVNGNLKLKVFDASEIKELVFDENNVYVQKEFISYKNNPRAKSPEKYLVRKEFETDDLSMYSFQNDEVVFFINDDEVGSSNRSYKFLMGFKNELKKFTGSCSKVNELIDKNYYKNNTASLRSFIEDVVYCE